MGSKHGEWRTSSFTSPDVGDCVELAYATTVRIRDTKDRDGGTLTLPTASWSPHRLTELQP